MTSSSFAVITSVPINIVRLVMRPFAHGATAAKLRLQHNSRVAFSAINARLLAI
jgi:hypothetical protein